MSFQSAEKLVEFGRQHIARGISRSTNLVIQQAKGSYIYDVQGKKFLDFSSGIGVTSLGHCHPKVVKAVQEQAAKLNHGQVNIMFHKPMLDLIGKLKPVMPSTQFDSFFFWNSGAEAVEAAVKLARHATKKQNVIVFQGGFHGRTFGTMSLTTSKTIYSAGFGPLMSGVYVAPYPYCFTCPIHRAVPQKYDRINCCDNPIEQVELLLKQQTAPDETAAMIVEPILGEGGYVVPPKSFFPKLREICTKNNILLICDEVQTGFGRTGKMFATEHFDVMPDIMVMAKGIASGFPLSGIVSNKKLMDTQPAGSMGGTYAGNAVSCAAAIATLEVFEEERILENVNNRSSQLFSLLNSRIKPLLPPHIGLDIRGLGLMVGLEFTGVPRGFVTAVSREAFETHDMIILTTGIYETLRLIPPLTVTADEISGGVEKLSNAVEVVLKKLAKDGNI
ncbi:23291_t:CDS:2 [Cetraspora pellucida]|uniref:23291_t:CDS:1 n=1 Tax=Cetraspora pellucida TaxID=1433469 RepID=A0A9N8VXG9_9GLOM|nr:23291_t:CDS:2 [Cetraspora pellucida]